MNIPLNELNERINNEFNYHIIKSLSDKALLDRFLQSDSVKTRINELTEILQEENISDDIITNIINKYITKLIPPGTKGVIRGNVFNQIIQDFIKNLNLNSRQFTINFEKKHPLYNGDEIPDWYINDTYNNKVLIGMNQLDLWSGGAQTNRASKYILQHQNTDNIKLVCVIYKYIQIKSTTNKLYKIFNSGYNKDILCYIGGLHLFHF